MAGYSGNATALMAAAIAVRRPAGRYLNIPIILKMTYDTFDSPLDRIATEETRESLLADLMEVERDLARELGLSGATTGQLLQLLRDGELKETRLVSRWASLYSALRNYAE